MGIYRTDSVDSINLFLVNGIGRESSLKKPARRLLKRNFASLILSQQSKKKLHAEIHFIDEKSLGSAGEENPEEGCWENILEKIKRCSYFFDEKTLTKKPDKIVGKGGVHLREAARSIRKGDFFEALLKLEFIGSRESYSPEFRKTVLKFSTAYRQFVEKEINENIPDKSGASELLGLSRKKGSFRKLRREIEALSGSELVKGINRVVGDKIDDNFLRASKELERFGNRLWKKCKAAHQSKITKVKDEVLALENVARNFIKGIDIEDTILPRELEVEFIRLVMDSKGENDAVLEEEEHPLLKKFNDRIRNPEAEELAESILQFHLRVFSDPDLLRNVLEEKADEECAKLFSHFSKYITHQLIQCQCRKEQKKIVEDLIDTAYLLAQKRDFEGFLMAQSALFSFENGILIERISKQLSKNHRKRLELIEKMPALNQFGAICNSPGGNGFCLPPLSLLIGTVVMVNETADRVRASETVKMAEKGMALAPFMNRITLSQEERIIESPLLRDIVDFGNEKLLKEYSPFIDVPEEQASDFKKIELARAFLEQTPQFVEDFFVENHLADEVIEQLIEFLSNNEVSGSNMLKRQLELLGFNLHLQKLMNTVGVEKVEVDGRWQHRFKRDGEGKSIGFRALEKFIHKNRGLVLQSLLIEKLSDGTAIPSFKEIRKYSDDFPTSETSEAMEEFLIARIGEGIAGRMDQNLSKARMEYQLSKLPDFLEGAMVKKAASFWGAKKR